MIHWNALAQVTIATLISTVLVVVAVSFGILALNRSTGKTLDETEPGEVSTPGRPLWWRLVGYGCLTFAGAVVLFGIYLIVPQFH
ncbi:hypothetical protein [Nakamurella lactea]|uniref:hypothetical protein n=1 Tax=Nakamurella lactea TaxID=459515 RepID=UPI0004919E08|nr:hypothetical protein [Nakamurella lactea]